MHALAGLRVLILENNEDCLEMFAIYLRSCGAHVAAAQNVVEALGYANGQRIDAILTDVSVLRGSVAHFLRDVREAPEYKDTPVIAVTGWTREDATRLAQASFSECIQKPVDMDVLVATIVRLAQPNAAQVS
jgi:CheY-like chemotaxis protein